MGDVRFERPLARLKAAEDRAAAIRALTDVEAAEALAAASRESDPYLANVLATDVLNRVRRATVALTTLADGVVVLDGDGGIVSANPGAVALLGASEEELRGRDFHEVTRHAEWRPHTPLSDGEAIPRHACAILECLRTGESAARANHDLFHRVDGSGFVVAFTVAPVLGDGENRGAVVLFRDVTQEMREHEDLVLFRRSLDEAPQAVFWLERDGSFLYANEAAGRHLGHTPEALCAMRVFDVDIELSERTWDDLWERLKREGDAIIETRHHTKDGRVRPVRVRVSHVEHMGAEFHVAFAVYLDDVSDDRP